VWIVPALLAMVVESVHRRSAGWLVVTVLTTSVFFVGAQLLPEGGGRELAWTPDEHLLGDCYVLLAVALLIVWTTPAVRPAWRASRRLLDRLLAIISR
jgi:alpha-1,2-mannosyltransferase